MVAHRRRLDSDLNERSFGGVGTAYRSLIKAYREKFFHEISKRTCTFNRDLRVAIAYVSKKIAKTIGDCEAEIEIEIATGDHV